MQIIENIVLTKDKIRKLLKYILFNTLLLEFLRLKQSINIFVYI